MTSGRQSGGARPGPALTLAVTATLVPLLALAPPALGHGRSVSYSSWTLTEVGARVEARLARIDLTRLDADAWDDAATGAYIAPRLVLLAGERPCEVVAAPAARAGEDGWLTLAWQVACPPGARAIASRLFLDVAPSHLHFARATLPDGTAAERVLSADEPRWTLGEDGAGASLGDYVALGVRHIAGGWDHLAFVLALVLLARSLVEVATVVTAFTAAHSVTLALAATGLVRPAPGTVEATIGFSIALVAAENVWLLGGRDCATPWLATAMLAALALAAALGMGTVPVAVLAGLALFARCHFGLLARSGETARLRALVAFAFGFVHGFGFAGVLAALELPRRRLLPALLGFNLGVEAGQLAVIAGAWALLVLVDRATAERGRRPLAEIGSAAICGLGLFWFVTRALGHG